MSPKVIVLIVAIVLIIIVGMVLTVKRSAESRRDKTVGALVTPGNHSISRCFIA